MFAEVYSILTESRIMGRLWLVKAKAFGDTFALSLAQVCGPVVLSKKEITHTLNEEITLISHPLQLILVAQFSLFNCF